MWDWDVLSGNTLPPPPTQEKKIPPLCPGEMRDRESSCLLFIRGGVSTYAETFLKVVSSLHSLILLIFTTFSFYTLTDYFFSAFNCVPVYQFINSLIHQRNPRYSFLFRILICVTFYTACPPSLSQPPAPSQCLTSPILTVCTLFLVPLVFFHGPCTAP